MRQTLLFIAIFYSGLLFAADINLNTASQAELEAVRGIGPVKAKAIIDYRSKNGPFRNIQELERVRGFDSTLVRNMRSDIKVIAPKIEPRRTLSDIRAASRGPVDINTASQAELESVIGIGPEKAKAIIDYRTKNGPFKTKAQLDNVKGFGEKSIDRFGNDLTVGRP